MYDSTVGSLLAVGPKDRTHRMEKLEAGCIFRKPDPLLPQLQNVKVMRRANGEIHDYQSIHISGSGN